MVIQAENVPSDQKKRVRDGTAGPKRTIRSGKASSRWYDRLEIYHLIGQSAFAMARQTGGCHQFTKSKFTLARQTGRLPSIYEKCI